MQHKHEDEHEKVHWLEETIERANEERFKLPAKPEPIEYRRTLEFSSPFG